MSMRIHCWVTGPKPRPEMLLLKIETKRTKTMLRILGNVTNRLADYTIGTVIVMVHIAMADRRAAVPALPGR